ncbi:VOC family protein [Listeria rocourtiae]|uniref:VOC family protein n=1 Tax=Listeria rocourtiae TaxID=647910 RepID=UPI003D2F863A
MLHHVEVNVSNLKEARLFWDDLLGCLGYSLYSEWEKGVSWIYGETYLVFVQTEARFLDAGYHRGQTGLNHLAFHVETRADVDIWTERFRAQEVPVLYEDRHPFAGGPDYYAVFVEGPDRMKVELVAKN